MGITREQVEKVWVVRPWETVADEGFVDTMGRQVFHLHCPVCDFFWRETGHKKYFRFCPHCGAPMTDKAVDILWKRLEAFNTAVGKEQEPVIDEKIKTAIRAGVFAIINSKYKNQIFWDDTHGYYGGPYRMDFSEAVTILLEFIGHPSLSEGQ